MIAHYQSCNGKIIVKMDVKDVLDSLTHCSLRVISTKCLLVTKNTRFTHFIQEQLFTGTNQNVTLFLTNIVSVHLILQRKLRITLKCTY